MKLIIKLLVFQFIFVSPFSYAQMGKYKYKRELTGVSGQWHKIILPDEIFGEVSRDFSDFRIYGITANNDTIEAPYLLKLTTETTSLEDITFNILNSSYTAEGHYYTLEIPAREPINQITLDFGQENFDWLVKLEGSHNQQQWFTILDKYRILSIKNGPTDFQFTRLTFPTSEYRYYRVFIESRDNPKLTEAKVSKYESDEGTLRNYAVQNINILDNKKNRSTIVDVDLGLVVPVARIKIVVTDTIDYYRPITIKYLTDSFETEKGMEYIYHVLARGTINSLEANEFRLNESTTLQKLRIRVQNGDNQPLNIESIEVEGYVHELLLRITEPASYYLVYGNPDIGKPHYDIGHFTNRIPRQLTVLALGDEQELGKETLATGNPLFKNKAWLWAIMTIIILLLGWFSLKMLRKN